MEQDKNLTVPTKMGRPTKYAPWMLDKVVECMAEGMSKHESAVALGIDIDTWGEWCKTNPEFSLSVKKGEALSRAWWEREGRISLRDEKFSPTLWYMNMRNRHGWSDKTETKTALSGEVNFRQIEVKLIE